MAPVTNKAKLEVDPKRTIANSSNDDDSDEGFVSPSAQRIGLKNRGSAKSESSNSSSSDNDSHVGSTSSSPPSSLELNEEDSNKGKNSESEPETGNPETVAPTVTPAAAKIAAEIKAESLAKFIVNTLLGKCSGDSSDQVDRTMLRCVRMMMTKHEILFKGMMKRMNVTKETTYVSFETVANTLFEEEKKVVTWARIVALYAFGGQLAIHCKEKGMEDLASAVSVYVGDYAKKVLTPFLTNIGGWVSSFFVLGLP